MNQPKVSDLVTILGACADFGFCEVKNWHVGTKAEQKWCFQKTNRQKRLQGWGWKSSRASQRLTEGDALMFCQHRMQVVFHCQRSATHSDWTRLDRSLALNHQLTHAAAKALVKQNTAHNAPSSQRLWLRTFPTFMILHITTCPGPIQNQNRSWISLIHGAPDSSAALLCDYQTGSKNGRSSNLISKDKQIVHLHFMWQFRSKNVEFNTLQGMNDVS